MSNDYDIKNENLFDEYKKAESGLSCQNKEKNEENKFFKTGKNK